MSVTFLIHPMKDRKVKALAPFYEGSAGARIGLRRLYLGVGHFVLRYGVTTGKSPGFPLHAGAARGL